ncbi:MAG: hypothetical protein IJC43_06955 [Clostridia bacterium]|nr:hypothetical protein [Clostridia bacterium]
MLKKLPRLLLLFAMIASLLGAAALTFIHHAPAVGGCFAVSALLLAMLLPPKDRRALLHPRARKGRSEPERLRGEDL